MNHARGCLATVPVQRGVRCKALRTVSCLRPVFPTQHAMYSSINDKRRAVRSSTCFRGHGSGGRPPCSNFRPLLVPPASTVRKLSNKGAPSLTLALMCEYHTHHIRISVHTFFRATHRRGGQEHAQACGERDLSDHNETRTRRRSVTALTFSVV